ncbi:30S ribosome-binding factor RbfA [Arenicella sp. 4NH20-0111]|uniref:30S ribosome-binding factor RbfA n=1 Tax=Arenicella sp. 4NH20-0111 TaxID=3127648 RepID=UPI003106B0E9
MPREFARSDRVAQTINRQLAMILRTKVKDERVRSLTITEVEVTKDLRQAKIFLTSMSDENLDIDATMIAVDNASGFIRGKLASVIEMRHCPNLIFVYDNSISEGAKMSALIDKALNKQ